MRESDNTIPPTDDVVETARADGANHACVDADGDEEGPTLAAGERASDRH